MFANIKQTAELVEIFRRDGKELTFKKGDYIIRPGDSPPGIFYIYKGLVKAYDITKYGEENLLIIRKEHEIFPLIWAMTGLEGHVIYEALAPTTVWQIDRDRFIGYMQSHPDALAPLLDMVVEMYRLHSERIFNLEYRTVRERIISFLLTMSWRFGEQTGEGLRITAPLRHQDIASSINSSRETTSRELSALERKGYLKSEQSFITLLDVPGLREQIGK